MDPIDIAIKCILGLLGSLLFITLLVALLDSFYFIAFIKLIKLPFRGKRRHNDFWFPFRFKVKKKIKKLVEVNMPKDWKLKEFQLHSARKIRNNVYTVYIEIKHKPNLYSFCGEIQFNLIDNSCNLPWGFPKWKEVD